MNDEEQTEDGGTRWKRFGAIFAIAAVATGGLLTSMANGAIAASFTISGGAFKISADQLRGNGVVQYGAVQSSPDGKGNPVLMVGMREAQMDNFCQSVVIPGPTGEMTIRITSAGQNGFTASNLLVGLQQATGTMTLKNAELGVDAGSVKKGPDGAVGGTGTFGIQADAMAFDGIKQTALSTTAGTLSLNQVQINALDGRHECF